MYLEMKLKQAKLEWRVLKFPRNCKNNIFKGKQAGCSFFFENLKTKTRYADVFKHRKQEKKLYKESYLEVI